MPVSWTMYHMAYAPRDQPVMPAIVVMPYNLTYLAMLDQGMPPGSSGGPGACPWLVWSAYWHMRTHAVSVTRNRTLEQLCCPRTATGQCELPLDRPHVLGINAAWEQRTHGKYSERACHHRAGRGSGSGHRGQLPIHNGQAPSCMHDDGDGR